MANSRSPGKVDGSAHLLGETVGVALREVGECREEPAGLLLQRRADGVHRCQHPLSPAQASVLSQTHESDCRKPSALRV